MTENNLHSQLAKASAEFLPIKKNMQNPHYKNYYADLSEIIRCTQPALSKYGISCNQIFADGKLITILSNGITEIKSEFPLPQESNIQKFGSTITYARRYSLSAILNVGSESDDDAEVAVSKPVVQSKPMPLATTYDSKNPSHKQKLAQVLKSLGVDINVHREKVIALHEELNGVGLEDLDHLIKVSVERF
jgi:hypothetical protein